MEYGISVITMKDDEAISVNYKTYCDEKEAAVMREATFDNIDDAMVFLSEKIKANMDFYKCVMNVFKMKGEL